MFTGRFRANPKILQECDCRTPCNDIKYTAVTSSLKFPSTHFAKSNNLSGRLKGHNHTDKTIIYEAHLRYMIVHGPGIIKVSYPTTPRGVEICPFYT